MPSTNLKCHLMWNIIRLRTNHKSSPYIQCISLKFRSDTVCTFMSLLGKQLVKMILSMLKEMCVIDIERGLFYYREANFGQ